MFGIAAKLRALQLEETPRIHQRFVRHPDQGNLGAMFRGKGDKDPEGTIAKAEDFGKIACQRSRTDAAEASPPSAWSIPSFLLMKRYGKFNPRMSKI